MSFDLPPSGTELNRRCTVDILASFVVRETLVEEEVGADWETEEAGIKPDFKSL